MSSRPGQRKLSKFLINNKEQKCIIYQKNHPTYLFECAHIKPRYMTSDVERKDFNIVNLICRNCHKIYDKGGISIDNGILIENEFLKNYDFEGNFKKSEYERSEKYFIFHFENIYSK